jgi:D-glycero-beta-D-manno-heptose 1-phosphate adenylyltransferase
LLNSEQKKFLEHNKNKKIIFTNGCFDILHCGHVSYLNEAKSLGELLIVGLNSDLSVKRLKGDSRPINQEQDRKYVLENLKAIDLVIIFKENTPLNLIKEITPDILVKGGDWSADQIVGSDFVISNGGSVQTLSFKNGHSTTNIIKKLADNS